MRRLALHLRYACPILAFITCMTVLVRPKLDVRDPMFSEKLARRQRVLGAGISLIFVGYGSTALSKWAARRDRQRAEAGLCVRCGYDLRASPGRCPECGASVSSVGSPKRIEVRN
jgi:hypothetical protein